jgi:lysophospholipase L1-like esterase
MGVLNGGIAGNKLLNDIIGPNSLSRFDRDALSQTGVTDVIVAMGNNDILFVFSPADVVSVEQIIDGHRQLIQRAHSRGLRIYGGTLTPFEGFFFSSPAKETMRQAVNAWIRTSGEYDAVLDFDAVLRDPTVPTRLRSLYDSGDHLHPSDLGYAAMANSINLKLFKNGRGTEVFGRNLGRGAKMAGEIVDTNSDQDYGPTSQDKSQRSWDKLIHQKDAPDQDGETSCPELWESHLLKRCDDGDPLESQRAFLGNVIGIKWHVEIYRCRQDSKNRTKVSRLTRT